MESTADIKLSRAIHKACRSIVTLSDYSRCIDWFKQYSEKRHKGRVGEFMASHFYVKPASIAHMTLVFEEVYAVIRCIQPLMVSARVIAYLTLASTAPASQASRHAIFVGKSVEMPSSRASPCVTVDGLGRMLDAASKTASKTASNAASKAASKTICINHSNVLFMTTIADVQKLMDAKHTVEDADIAKVTACLKGRSSSTRAILKALMLHVIAGGMRL
jgi:hypothetical protein